MFDHLLQTHICFDEQISIHFIFNAVESLVYCDTKSTFPVFF